MPVTNGSYQLHQAAAPAKPTVSIGNGRHLMPVTTILYQSPTTAATPGPLSELVTGVRISNGRHVKSVTNDVSKVTVFV